MGDGAKKEERRGIPVPEDSALGLLRKLVQTRKASKGVIYTEKKARTAYEAGEINVQWQNMDEWHPTYAPDGSWQGVSSSGLLKAIGESLNKNPNDIAATLNGHIRWQTKGNFTDIIDAIGATEDKRKLIMDAFNKEEPTRAAERSAAYTVRHQRTKELRQERDGRG